MRAEKCDHLILRVDGATWPTVLDDKNTENEFAQRQCPALPINASAGESETGYVASDCSGVRQTITDGYGEFKSSLDLII